MAPESCTRMACCRTRFTPPRKYVACAPYGGSEPIMCVQPDAASSASKKL